MLVTPATQASGRHQRRLQNADVKPSWPNSCSISSTVLRRHCGCLRSGEYHDCANRQPVSSDNTAPRLNRHDSHQRSTCSSDRKKSMVFHVKTMSFHHSRAGMAKWITPSPRTEPLSTTTSAIVPQSPQLVVMRASRFSMAGIPRASQMQLPYARRPEASTANGVGTAENGLAMRISPLSRCRTRMCASARRRNVASASSAST